MQWLADWRACERPASKGIVSPGSEALRGSIELPRIMDMRFLPPLVAAVVSFFIPHVEATNVAVSLVEQPVNLGAFADPASIPLGPVAVECNYNYGLHAVISKPRPCQFGSMDWKEGTALDQNLAHVFGIMVEPEDSTTVPGKPVKLHVKAWPAPAYSPYTREQVMAATLHCLLRATNATPKFPLQIQVACDNPADKSWADKFAGDYVRLADSDGQPVQPTPVPGCRVETDRLGISRVIFLDVTKTAATPARPPVLIPFRPHDESDEKWILLPVWPGDTFIEPLNVLGRPYTLYYDLFNPADSGSPQVNALFEGSSSLNWSIHESPTESTAHLDFGIVDSANLAAFLHAVVFSVQPSAAKPLAITLRSHSNPPDYFQNCLDAGGWTLGTRGGDTAVTGTFVLDANTNKLIKGSIPGLTLVSDGKQLLRLTAPTEKEAEAATALQAKREQVKDDAEAIGAALESYRVASGAYPTEEQGLAALVEKPESLPIPKRWVQLMKNVPFDPWGHPYRLVIREKDGKPQAIIASQGPDPDSKEDDLEVEVPAEKE
jgi:type II secretion system protein G